MIGIVFATIVGFTMGIARLSTNWLIARLATVYVETIRNIPLLLQLFVWYFAVLKAVPPPRQSWSCRAASSSICAGSICRRRCPSPASTSCSWRSPSAIFVAIAIALWARRRQRHTGAQFPSGLAALVLIVGLPAAVFVFAGAPLDFAYPQAARLQFRGRHRHPARSSWP